MSGIKENELSQSAKFYPNPTTGQVEFTNETNETFSLSIFDFKGDEIKKLNNMKNKKYSFDLSPFSNGEYFLKIIYQSGKTETHRIIKQN